jgi:hypothetical protein
MWCGDVLTRSRLPCLQVQRILAAMKKRQIKQNVETYNMQMMLHARLLEIDEAFSLCDTMTRKKGILPNDATFTVLFTACKVRRRLFACHISGRVVCMMITGDSAIHYLLCLIRLLSNVSGGVLQLTGCLRLSCTGLRGCEARLGAFRRDGTCGLPAGQQVRLLKEPMRHLRF